MLENNLARMKRAASLAGKALRPHAKTHKCSRLAQRQLAAGAIGICAAKLSEAEALVRAGIRGVLVTGPMSTVKLIDRLLALIQQAPDILVVVDQVQNARALEIALAARGQRLDVLLDVDIGLHRTGAPPANAMLLAEEILRCPHLRLCGVQAYAGHLQHITGYAERGAASRACLHSAAEVFQNLSTRVATCRIFSGGGTGTAAGDLADSALTEIQPGSYVFMDSEYLAIEQDPQATELNFEPALRLLTTVISANQPGFVTVDAGLKAVYRDGGAPISLESERSDLRFDWFGDEYGMVSYTAGHAAPSVGTMLSWTVSHCDPTINLHDRLHVVLNGEVVDQWPIDLRGCST